MPKDMIADIKVEAVAGKPVELPNGHFIANAEMTRSGMDLHLTSGGHTIVVEGYFAQHPAPDLVSHDGARLTPAMVDAFVPPEHAGQYASSGQITNDASPAGKITQVVGDATIVHADGTKVAATVGALIYQGDVIETSKTGAVNILFADNTTFAISESARMSVDQFTYHPADHSGSTFFSMLQGVFVYTSGLIGKHDAGAVNIETPVGSIGIRGTVVAGHILPAGQTSQITILDGAITVTNGTGVSDMSTSLQTIALNSYQSQGQVVQADAQTISHAYSAVSSVAGETLSHFAGAPSPAPNSQPEHTPAGAPTAGSETAPAPAGATAPAPHAAPTGSAAPAPSTTTDTTQTASATTSTTTTATTTTLATTDTVTAPPPPSSTSTFTSTTNTSSFGTSTGTTSFSAPATSTTSGTSTTSAPPPASTTTTSTTTTTTAPPPPTPLAVGLASDTGFNSSDNYTSNAALKVTGAVSGTIIQYKVDNGGWVNTAPASLADGSHTVTVQELDANNNVIATSAPLTFTLDTTAPTMTATNTTDHNATSIAVNTPMSATLTFSETLGAAPTPSTFRNVGTAGVTVDSVTATGTVNQYIVQYHTTSTGTLQMQATGLADLAGNPVTAASAIESTVINVGQMTSTLIATSGLQVFSHAGTPIAGSFLPVLSNAGDGVSYQVTVTSGGLGILPGGGTQALANAPANTLFAVNSGQLVVMDPMALEAGQTGSSITLNIAATDTVTGLAAGNEQITLNVLGGGIYGPVQYDSASSYTGTNGAGADFIVGTGTGGTIIGGGGADAILGSNGNDVIQIGDNTFKLVNGGLGNNTLDLGGFNYASFNTDFTTFGTTGQTVRNISSLELDASTSGGSNGAIIDAQSAYMMTPADINGNHTLTVFAQGTAMNSHLSIGTGLTLTSGIWGADPVLTYTGLVTTPNGSVNVTINVDESVSGSTIFDAAGIQVIDANHTTTPTFVTGTTNAATSSNELMVDQNTSNNGGVPNTFTTAFTYSLAGDGGFTNDSIICTGAGDNLISISNTGFGVIDGGAGYDRLQLAPTTSVPFNLDFTALAAGQAVRNIEEIDLGGSTLNTGNTVKLDVSDVFAMTTGTGTGGLTHTLSILENNTSATGAGINVVTSTGTGHFTYVSGTAGTTWTFQGSYGGGTNNVTLVIHDTVATGAGHIAVAQV